MSDYELMGYDEEFVLYSGRGGATFYAYSFENRQLAGSLVYVDAAAYANTLVEFLAERYVVVYVDEEEEVFAGFVNIEENMLIGLRIVELLEEYFVTVMYLPYEATEATAKRSAASFVPQGIPEGLHAVPLKGTEYAKQVVRQFVQE